MRGTTATSFARQGVLAVYSVRASMMITPYR